MLNQFEGAGAGFLQLSTNACCLEEVQMLTLWWLCDVNIRIDLFDILLHLHLSWDSNHNSRFAKKARENQWQLTGGKTDDITVVLATVEREA